MSQDRLLETLEAGERSLPAGGLVVAYSGGLDSTALLHQLASMPAARERGLRAIHIDHGLQANSAVWGQHCHSVAAELEVPLQTIAVAVGDTSGIGLEGAARRARHAALQEALQTGEILVFGHHRDDQAETVLLKLMRAAGPQGLGGMRSLRVFGPGFAWRPLLDLPRAALHRYALRHGLAWIEDPSNRDSRFDRNYLRLQLLPALRERWPEADSSLARSAVWAQTAADYIDTQARLALSMVQGFDPTTLRLPAWLALPEALRDPVLRLWLRGIGMREPTWFQAAELQRQLTKAEDDRLPCVAWPGTEVRRYRDLLHALQPQPAPEPGWRQPWHGEHVQLPAALGSVQMVADEDCLPHATHLDTLPPMQLRLRRSGERLRLAGEMHHRPLRDVLQMFGIPPWQRSRLPLLVDAQDDILAIADLSLSEAGANLFHQHRCRLDWQPAH